MLSVLTHSAKHPCNSQTFYVKTSIYTCLGAFGLSFYLNICDKKKVFSSLIQAFCTS